MSTIDNDQPSTLVDAAVAEGGAYDIIRQRLIEQGRLLKEANDSLNAERLKEFGAIDMDVIARIRVRTENNSVARDVVQVGEYLLFGYNVFIGLKKETKIEDVFSLYSFINNDDGYELETVPTEANFLYHAGFKQDFEELYRYYKDTKLIELTLKNDKLLAAFQIGERIEDMRVFRWSISPDGKTVTYIDNRGERDIQLPNAYDFEWQETKREHVVHGRHAHINILDTVFVDTIAGDLTVKIENNTEDGLGIYREPVEDQTQSLDDAKVFYAKVGALILLKILPYREQKWRYLIFNTLTETALRVDRIGESCIQLPEDHGVIFPGGYYLQTGEYKTFEESVDNFRFKRMIRSPNGEDVLFVFYEPVAGAVALLGYNMINKSLSNPIFGHGYALFADGRIVIFTAEDEPSRVHPMQIWQSPYISMEYASQLPVSKTFFGRIGNAELVRGISDIYSVHRIVQNQSVSLKLYEELSRISHKLFDNYYWLAEKELADIADIIRAVEKTSELVIDEFEKVESIRKQSAKAMQEAEAEQKSLLANCRYNEWEGVEGYVDALGQLRKHQGRLVTLKEYRYIDVQLLQQLENEIVQVVDELSAKTVNFLADAKALKPFSDRLGALNTSAEKATSSAELAPIIEGIETLAGHLDLLSELLATLAIADATLRTQIIDAISEVYSNLNQCKARIKNKQKNVGSEESKAQFSAQFKLFSQSIHNAFALANSPEKCDEQLGRLLVQLESFESQFSDVEEFLVDIMAKRDEVNDAFEAHKQQLLDEQQRKASAVADAVVRILNSVEKRSLKFKAADELNTFFASDILIGKVREMVARLRELNAAVKADDIEAKLKAIKEQAIRALRDKSDIFEDDGKVIKLGPRHKFSVNQQELDLTLIPKDNALYLHLTGTNYLELLQRDDLNSLQPYWNVNIESESPQVYRAEYLAYSLLEAARNNVAPLSQKRLNEAFNDQQALDQLVKDYAGPRYKEGYQKGVHDHDAVLILQKIIPAIRKAETLKFQPLTRALAQLFWVHAHDALGAELWSQWASRAQSAQQLQDIFASHHATDLLIAELAKPINAFIVEQQFTVAENEPLVIAEYLVAELARDNFDFAISQYADKLVELLTSTVDPIALEILYKNLESLRQQPRALFALARAWLQALVDSPVNKGDDKNHSKTAQWAFYCDEAAVILCAPKVPRRRLTVELDVTVEGLLGDHPKLQQQTLFLSLNRFIAALREHTQTYIPNYQRYLALRAEVMNDERKKLRLHEFKPRPLSSFVRNRLINESYLPIIGDNLAKQMGTVGDSKRTDLMGLLMMISPPGYGKTTLMEYVASRLGLIFMKINCPSLGHDVLSLDPAQAPNATAAQELHKLNLALEMGNNVMLYLDDIQHTDPEFLQKFISLCDGTRRIEGVWRGQTKTYDMRGRKFCVVMAGNPYTESGDVFKVPDMLANRADIYNLGDILGGMDEQFAMSYIENSLTSNAVLAPLALRPLDDVYKLIAMAEGQQVATTDLSHVYSGAEIAEICDVFKKMFVVRDVILKINQQYIASAAQNDKYRTEPPFKLQGSYRNMNKMAEKISSVMTTDELMRMIDDHYQGESQLLTSGAEDNLLKLAQLRGTLTETQAKRFADIKKDYLKYKDSDSDTDGAQRIAQKIGEVTLALKEVQGAFNRESAVVAPLQAIANMLSELTTVLANNNQRAKTADAVPAAWLKPIENMAAVLEKSATDIVASIDKSVDFDITIIKRITKLSSDLKAFSQDNRLVKKKEMDAFDELDDAE
ncbi:MAG: DNA repair ATPase [Marinagarivorans sp.]|nr:DNA repair ATPase [Marinagarivorans sp.]